MADEETKEEQPVPDTGMLILQELRTMNRLLGAINQNITSTLAPIKEDVEMCKVNLGRLRKLGGQEVVVRDERSQSAPQEVPLASPGSNQL